MLIDCLDNLIATILREDDHYGLADKFIDYSIEGVAAFTEEDKPILIEVLDELYASDYISENAKGEIYTIKTNLENG